MSVPDDDEARRLLANIVIFEKRIKQYSDEDSKKYKDQISSCLSQLRSLYRNVLLNCSSYLMAENKDIDGSMWKTCFYKRIEEYRTKIRKYNSHVSTAIEKQKAQLPFPYTVDQLQAHVASLVTSLTTFLSDSMVFYQSFIAEIEGTLVDVMKGPNTEPDSAAPVIKPRASGDASIREESSSRSLLLVSFKRRCIHRCLLYLGDLSRYKELYSSSMTRSYGEAEKYYERAAMLNPTAGNAQNQLAVLATYEEKQCIAIYHYCRSIMVDTPFSGGFDNLSILFTKNKKAYDALLEQQRVEGNAARQQPLGMSRKNQELEKTKSFLTKFVRCHGTLFEVSTQMHASFEKMGAAPASSSSSSSSSSVNTEGIEAASGAVLSGQQQEEFDLLVADMLDELDKQLASACFGDALLVRFLIICIFSVHYAAHPSDSILLQDSDSFTSQSQSTVRSKGEARNSDNGTPGSNSSTRSSSSSAWPYSSAGTLPVPSQPMSLHEIERTRLQQQNKKRIVSESLALKLLFMFINRIVSKITQTDKSRRGAAMRSFLPVLSVFSDWASVHAHYLYSSFDCMWTAAEEESKDGDFDGGYRDMSAPAGKMNSLSTNFAVSQLSTSQSQNNVCARTSRSIPISVAKYFADRNQIRAEIRSRSSLRTSLTLFKDMLSSSMQPKETDATYVTALVAAECTKRQAEYEHRPRQHQQRQPQYFLFLPEMLELRGFLPLSVIYEPNFTGFDVLFDSFASVPDNIAKLQRSQSVLKMVNCALIPIASYEQAAEAEQRKQQQQQQQHSSNALSGGRGGNQKARQQQLWMDPDTPTEKRKAGQGGSNANSNSNSKSNLRQKNRDRSKRNDSGNNNAYESLDAEDFPVPVSLTAQPPSSTAAGSTTNNDNVWAKLNSSAVKQQPLDNTDHQQRHLEQQGQRALSSRDTFTFNHQYAAPISVYDAMSGTASSGGGGGEATSQHNMSHGYSGQQRLEEQQHQIDSEYNDDSHLGDHIINSLLKEHVSEMAEEGNHASLKLGTSSAAVLLSSTAAAAAASPSVTGSVRSTALDFYFDDGLDDEMVVFKPAFARSSMSPSIASAQGSRATMSGLLSDSQRNSSASLHQLGVSGAGTGVAEQIAAADSGAMQVGGSVSGPLGLSDYNSDFSLSFFELSNPSPKQKQQQLLSNSSSGLLYGAEGGPDKSPTSLPPSGSSNGLLLGIPRTDSGSRLRETTGGGVEYGSGLSPVGASPNIFNVGSLGEAVIGSNNSSRSPSGTHQDMRGGTTANGRDLWGTTVTINSHSSNFLDTVEAITPSWSKAAAAAAPSVPAPSLAGPPPGLKSKIAGVSYEAADLLSAVGSTTARSAPRRGPPGIALGAPAVAAKTQQQAHGNK